MNDAAIEAMAEVFKALGDPTRLRILLVLLHEGEQSVGNLAESVGMSDSAVSHQLRLLRNLRIVSTERQGRTIVYRLDDNHIAGLLQQAVDHQSH